MSVFFFHLCFLLSEIVSDGATLNGKGCSEVNVVFLRVEVLNKSFFFDRPISFQIIQPKKFLLHSCIYFEKQPFKEKISVPTKICQQNGFEFGGSFDITQFDNAFQRGWKRNCEFNPRNFRQSSKSRKKCSTLSLSRKTIFETGGDGGVGRVTWIFGENWGSCWGTFLW